MLFDLTLIVPWFSSVQSFNNVQFFATPWTAACQASLSITNSRSLFKLMSLSQWCHPTISSSLFPFSSCLQSFPASGSFPKSEFFASGGQSIEVSASASVLPMNIQDWFPLGWTGWISLQSKVLSRVFSNTTVQSISSSVPWYIYHIMSQNGKKQVLKFVLPLNWENQRTGLPYGLRNPWPLRNYLMWFMCPIQHNICDIFQVTNQLLSIILALETNEWAR